MKYVMTLLVIMVVGFGTLFFTTNIAESNDACFQVTSSQWGGQCNEDPNSLELTVQNVCNNKMALLYCLAQEGGRKDCKVKENIEGKASFKISACKATGSYEFTGCERGYDCKQELKKITGK